jgi:hypothetical protein
LRPHRRGGRGWSRAPPVRVVRRNPGECNWVLKKNRYSHPGTSLNVARSGASFASLRPAPFTLSASSSTRMEATAPPPADGRQFRSARQASQDLTRRHSAFQHVQRLPNGLIEDLGRRQRNVHGCQSCGLWLAVNLTVRPCPDSPEFLSSCQLDGTACLADRDIALRRFLCESDLRQGCFHVGNWHARCHATRRKLTADRVVRSVRKIGGWAGPIEHERSVES